MPTPPAPLLLCKPFSFLYKFGFSKRADNRAEPPSNYLLPLRSSSHSLHFLIAPQLPLPWRQLPVLPHGELESGRVLGVAANACHSFARTQPATHIFHLFSTSVWARVGGDTTACLLFLNLHKRLGLKRTFRSCKLFLEDYIKVTNRLL